MLNKIDENSFSISNQGSIRSSNLDLASPSSNKKKYSLAIDYDEVLVNMNNKWAQKLVNSGRFDSYLTENHKLILSIDANLRSVYDVFSWLGVEKDSELFNYGMDLYFNDSRFYDDLKPSKYFESLYQIRHMISEIHIITKCGEDLDAPCNISKKKQMVYLFRNFDGINMGFHMIKGSDSKAQYFKNKGIKFDSFVDDSSSNMIDMINVFKDEFNFEALMPLYGYNYRTAQEAPIEWLADDRNNFQFFHNLDNIDSSDMSKIIKGLSDKDRAKELETA